MKKKTKKQIKKPKRLRRGGDTNCPMCAITGGCGSCMVGGRKKKTKRCLRKKGGQGPLTQDLVNFSRSAYHGLSSMYNTLTGQQHQAVDPNPWKDQFK